MKNKTKISGEISREKISERTCDLKVRKIDYLVARDVAGTIGIPISIGLGMLLVGMQNLTYHPVSNPDLQIWSDPLIVPCIMGAISSYLTFRYLPKKISKINAEISELEKLAGE